MARLLLLSTLFTFALTAASLDTCAELARQCGKPTDGWVTYTDSNGDQRCKRVTVDTMCRGEEYYDPVSLVRVSVW